MAGYERLARPWPALLRVSGRATAVSAGSEGRQARPTGEPGSAPPRRRAAATAATLVLCANVLAISGVKVPFIGPALGFWFLVLHPVYLVYTTALWDKRPFAERLGYSATAVLLALMAGGLALNAVLPLVGVARPLDTVPVVIFGDLLTIGLFALRQRFPAWLDWRQAAALRVAEGRLVAGSTVCVALAVLGANRLNNGAGDQASLACLAAIVVVFALILRWQERIRDSIAGVCIYLLALALLLMNSLRGWYVTGHDVQTEYRVFQLTSAHGHWSISAFHSAYNACLSITILPTEIARAVNVDNPYVYKFFFQLLFALCPVLVYAISRRTWSRFVSVLALVFFVGFPTFFTDMPSLNRQEIAFLFVCAGIMAITDQKWSLARRRGGMCIAAVGVELSHYSTMYVFLGVLVLAWGYDRVGRLSERRKAWAPAHSETAGWASARGTVGIGAIAVVVAILGLWGGLATQTVGQSLDSVKSALSELTGNTHGTTPYSLFSRHAPQPQKLLNTYRQQTLQANAAVKLPIYIPATVAASYPTPVVTEPSLSLTSAGRLLERAAIPVSTLNTDVRQGAAKDEQLFVLLGFAGILFSRQMRRQMSRELFLLCAGSLTILGMFTVLPNLSVDYGVLRAFQESLILIAPILVTGAMTVFSLFGTVWDRRLTAAAGLLIFISTTGLLPQLLGGYQAQLGLNNSGQYYDSYYVQPQDAAAVAWLSNKPGVLPGGMQTTLGPTTANRFYFTSPSLITGAQAMSEAYPTQILRLDWVLLPESVVHQDLATIYIDGVLINYRYPTGLLAGNKDLVYNNGGTEIYR